MPQLHRDDAIDEPPARPNDRVLDKVGVGLSCLADAELGADPLNVLQLESVDLRAQAMKQGSNETLRQ